MYSDKELDEALKRIVPSYSKQQQAMDRMTHLMEDWVGFEMVQCNGKEENVSLPIGDQWTEWHQFPGLRVRRVDLYGEVKGLVWKLPHGLVFPRHFHKSDEIIIMLRGEMRLYIEDGQLSPWRRWRRNLGMSTGRYVLMREGDSVFMPRGTPHAGDDSKVIRAGVALSIFQPGEMSEKAIEDVLDRIKK